MTEEKKRKLIAILEIVTGAGIALFWVGFFTIGLAPENPPACYFAYEHSFPLPDGVLSLALVSAGALLLKGKRGGVVLSLYSAGGLVFLGLLDFCFNFLNGVYAASAGDLISNGFINLWCVVFGAWMLLGFRKD
jgi:hypothetical protein